MKKWSMLGFVLILLFVTGCRQLAQIEIDWVDFIKINGVEYNGIYSGVLADKHYVGEKIGTVNFRVGDNVTSPSYRIKNGDAAFHEKGTEIFQIKDQPHLIAVKDARAINGYRIYFSRDNTEYQWHFKDMPIDKVKLIEIYQADSPRGDKLISKLTIDEEVDSFLQLLVESNENPNFQPNISTTDPLLYKMIFYTEDPIAYMYNMQFDGDTYYWYPWDTNILSDEIKVFINGD